MSKTRKHISPNKLSFLQSQILQRLYIDIHHQMDSDMEDIANLTDYKKESKILNEAINALVNKDFIEGSFEAGFVVPEHRKDLFEKVVVKNDYQHKAYSLNLLKFQYVNKFNGKQQSIFDTIKTISDINSEGVCHRWYDYLEDFPYTLIEEKINAYHISKDSFIVEPFAGSGTTNVTAKFFDIDSAGFDANPLMAFISEVKTTWDIDIKQFKDNIIHIAHQFLENIHDFDSLGLDEDFTGRMPKKELNQ